ncbi:MAG: prepilin peptidase [Candidatus Brocadiaceae bacterium]|nr:prepilin peptidase [Candidatus Brocadiaceae bacterium]
MPIAALTALEGLALFLFFVLGLIVGSFLNVCIWRLPRGISVNFPRRSLCPRCGHSLAWADNIPVVSFLRLRGRCRYCSDPVSWRYPCVELITGLLFALIYFRQRVQVGTDLGQVVVMLLLAALLVVASGIDLEFLIIPDEISAFGVLGGLLAGFLLPQLHVGPLNYHTFESLTGHVRLDGLIASGIGAVGGGSMVLAFALLGQLVFRKEAMGLGDVKLMAMIGAFFGWRVVFMTFFLAPFVGLLYGLPMLLMNDEHVMPYGPFLSIGAVVTLVFRDDICRYPAMLEEVVRLLAG